MIQRLFTEHPRSVDESYFQHLAAALGFSARLALAALVCLIHALLPFLFVRTGSAMITALHDRMVTNRRRGQPGAPARAREDQDVPMARLQRSARLS